MTILFSADHHFLHANILRPDRDGRPFPSIEEHDETLIKNWNSRVDISDTVYYLGDLIWSKDRIRIRRITSRLKGKIHLIEGNHDKRLIKHAIDRFEAIDQLISIPVKHLSSCSKAPLTLTLCHYPLQTWKKSCYPRNWHIHGHSHGRLKTPSKWSLDVGVMNTSWYPVTLDELIDLMIMKWNNNGR